MHGRPSDKIVEIRTWGVEREWLLYQPSHSLRPCISIPALRSSICLQQHCYRKWPVAFLIANAIDGGLYYGKLQLLMITFTSSPFAVAKTCKTSFRFFPAGFFWCWCHGNVASSIKLLKMNWAEIFGNVAEHPMDKKSLNIKTKKM